MRENTKWIMLITALAFVGLMVFEWGMDLTGQSSAQLAGGEIGQVNGQGISYEEYINAYRSLYDQEQRASPEPIGAATNKRIEDAAFDQLVMQRLINQELRRRGIQVTNQEIREAARFAPPPELMADPNFQTDGQFDPAKYQTYLANQVPDEGLLSLEAYYRDLIPRSKLYFQVTAGTYVTDAELWASWRDLNETAAVDYTAFDPAELVDEASITISSADIERYYREHRDDFARPARASVRFVAIDRKPLPEDSAAARERANALRTEIEGGADFAEVAARESADSISAADGGRLEIMRGEAVPALDAAAFSLPPGQLSEPLLTQFGYHVLRVDSRSGDSATVRHILVPIAHSPETEDALFDRADSLEVLTETLSFDAVAADLGLQLRDAELLVNLPFIPAIGDASEGTDWAFEEGVVGEISPVFEGRDAYYVFELVTKEEERILSLDEARPTIEAALRADRRLEQATGMVRELVDRIRNGESLEDAAATLGSDVRSAGPFTRNDFVPGLGRFSPAIGAAFGLPVGRTSGVVVSDRALFILRKTGGTPASREEWEAQKEEQRLRMTDANAEQRWGQFLTALRESARIQDLRAEFARQAEAAAAQARPPLF